MCCEAEAGYGLRRLGAYSPQAGQFISISETFPQHRGFCMLSFAGGICFTGWRRSCLFFFSQGEMSCLSNLDKE